MSIPSTHTSASVDSSGAEGLPDDCLTDVGCNEERDTRTQTIALLEQLIQQQDDQTCNKQLEKQHSRFILSQFRRTTSCSEQLCTTKHNDSHNEPARV